MKRRPGITCDSNVDDEEFHVTQNEGMNEGLFEISYYDGTFLTVYLI